MNYEEMSDLEINKLVAKYVIKGRTTEMGDSVIYNMMEHSPGCSSYERFNPCNDWGDAGKIISENGISIIADDSGFYAAPPIKHYAQGGESGRFDFECEFAVFGYDPLIAAMICFLKMKDGENK